ncbi:carbohydrate kinase [Tateyamaria omphalii]|uniref:carbohydrate kinase family protein n=1 Tax=Tateyamaria omphalii TaxID=299262 RepID=UPI0016798DD5|nr:carbohydrate kinase [Tateyamaria omphalii]GGX59030.1 carbohydrate kinase [Tateyamaria omphalii]
MILCAGEALIDMIPNADGAYVPHVGGAVLNTAVALGRLGEPVGLITGLSSDPFGAMIEDHLTASHVSTDHAVRSDRNTTLAFVHLDQGNATYTFYDDKTATRSIQPVDIAAVPAGTEAVFFGGISLCNPPVADSLLDLALSQPADRLVMADPNIRPGFISDHDGYRARLTRLIGRADIVKLSDDDITWLVPDGDLNAKAQAVLGMGPKLLLLTEGGDGATAHLANGTKVRVAAEKAQVVDTVGAGDTFNAGCLAALRRAGALPPSAIAALDENTLTDMLTLAARAAAITVSRAGANPPWQTELD